MSPRRVVNGSPTNHLVHSGATDRLNKAPKDLPFCQSCQVSHIIPYEDAVADVRSAVAFHIETFGSEVFEDKGSGKGRVLEYGGFDDAHRPGSPPRCLL